MFAMIRRRLLFALAFAGGALFAYLLVHHVWQSQRSVLVATFDVIRALAKARLSKSLSDVNLFKIKPGRTKTLSLARGVTRN
jgi:hypothetical protein